MFQGVKKFFTEAPDYQRYQTREARLKFADSLIAIGLTLFGASILGMLSLLVSISENQPWLMLVVYAATMFVGIRFRNGGLEVYELIYQQDSVTDRGEQI